MQMGERFVLIFTFTFKLELGHDCVEDLEQWPAGHLSTCGRIGLPLLFVGI